jgi:hypothetical protein
MRLSTDVTPEADQATRSASSFSAHERRDFASRSSIEAAHYAVTVEADHAEEAGRLLAQLPTTPGR